MQPVDGTQLLIRGDTVQATSPEGVSATQSLSTFLGRLAPPRLDTGGILPDGVKAVVSHPYGLATVWVGEFAPRIWRFRWIAADSPVPYGEGATYRHVSVALPYVLVFATFSMAGPGLTLNRKKCEMFFRTQSLASFDDEMLGPALLNVSAFRADLPHKPIAWICTQHLVLSPTAALGPDNHRRMVAGYKQLLQVTFGQGFNYSSEHHTLEGETGSWYTASRHVDPRISTIERWEAATQQDPLFVLDVPWLRTGHTLRTLIQRIFTQTLELLPVPPPSADSLARIVFAS